DLAAADVRGEEVRPALDHVQADDRAAGRAQQRELAVPEPAAGEVRGGDTVAGESLDAQRTDARTVLALPRARTGLTPVAERVALLPRRDEWRPDARRRAGARHDQERRIAHVGAADRDPLLDTVDGHERAFVDRRPARVKVLCHFRLLVSELGHGKRK